MAYTLVGELLEDSFFESGERKVCKIQLCFSVDEASPSCSEWINFKASIPSSSSILSPRFGSGTGLFKIRSSSLTETVRSLLLLKLSSSCSFCIFLKGFCDFESPWERWPVRGGMNRLVIPNFREKQDKMLHLTEGITHQLKTCSNNVQLIIVFKNSL